MEDVDGTRDGGSGDDGQATREGSEDEREGKAGGREEDDEERDDGEEDEPGAGTRVAGRGDNPPEPEDRAAPRIVGRASERGPRAAELHYFLVLTPDRRSGPKRARNFEWKRRDQLTTAALAAAFDLLPAERRGSDPTGDGWVVEVTDARDGPEGREYRVRWFVWAQGARAPLGKRQEWRMYADFVNKTLADAFEDGLRAEVGVAEDAVVVDVEAVEGAEVVEARVLVADPLLA